MKIPEFRLCYMAILAGLASVLPPGASKPAKGPAMTHLSWDEFGARVLERRKLARSGMRSRAQSGLALVVQALVT
ncbi:hypothetical protein [Bradyrhizobium sp. UNPF46]|uniref:hypothetical protein n=1 Tax=Bradyrhizobium sp. UNPF46 TaxID=1141168 RepID=UPI0015F0CE9D|nr:hypothetical protein [Bradyrhizobium sp. UNPF46]